MLRTCVTATLAVSFLAIPLLAEAQTTMMSAEAMLPTNARPGECYARVYTPPQFRTVTDTVLKKAASERIEVIPERYDWSDETVMVKPASERIVEVVPAEYRWEEEKIMVKPASEKIDEVPATYRTVTEQQLVKPAATVWKRGRGPIEKIDNQTGEIMCLVEEPAEYRTVTRTEIETPATTRRITIPAEYQTVRRQVLVKEAEVRREQVPAQYQTVRAKKLIEPAREQRIPIPAEYQTISRQEKVADGRMEWRLVLCETNATPETVEALQRALLSAGFSPGKIDGRLGPGTANAVTLYQKANGLPEGGITLDVLERLGVPFRRGGGQSMPTSTLY